MHRPVYVGIDLGTTNSAAAIFDGEQVHVVRSGGGGSITPSVVRIDARGNTTVGAKARRFLDTDASNTRAEFKRLMGTRHVLEFAAAKVSKKPEELAALVLEALRRDVRDQAGIDVRSAVVTVPALFELPQSAATAEAARLAGFDRIELLQEPVASAIAAGWSAAESTAPWLVYDLGGGTFDVSLLETNEGVLRVVGHDGDNFLGGRDIDAAIVDWALKESARSNGVSIDAADPAHAIGLRRLRLLAEEAKIELARAPNATLALPEAFVVGGASVDLDLVLDTTQFEALVAPLVDRSIAICRRLLAKHGLTPGQLSRIVLVGGPTALPLLRARVGEALVAPFGVGLDPMTLVAQGAALYAATAGLDARPAPVRPASPTPGPKVWLQYPAVSADLAPYVVGKLVASAGALGATTADRDVVEIVFRRGDGAWTSAPEPLDAEGTFAASVGLAPRQMNLFHVEGVLASGATVALDPPTISITHGLTIGDPPLPRSVGIALADNRVQVFLERGAPLPMRRTFTLTTVETVVAAHAGAPAGALALRVPIVQGDFGLAHLCRLVGTLEIPAAEVRATLAAGSSISITLAVDRGGALTATAHVPSLSQSFDGVAHLSMPVMSPAELVAKIAETRRRVEKAFAEPEARSDAATRATLVRLDALLDGAIDDGERAKGGDADSLEKARRTLLDVDGQLADLETQAAWPKLVRDADFRLAWALQMVGTLGTSTERDALDRCAHAVRRGLEARDAGEVERQLRLARQLGIAAYYRDPNAWDYELEFIEQRIADTLDVPRARALVRDAHAARGRNDAEAFKRAVRALQELRPTEAVERDRGHRSGVR